MPAPDPLTRPLRRTLTEVYAAERADIRDNAGGGCGRVCPWNPDLECGREAGHGDGLVFADVHVADGPDGLTQWHENDQYIPAPQPPAGEPGNPPGNGPESVLAALAAELGYDDPETLRADLTALHNRRDGQ